MTAKIFCGFFSLNNNKNIEETRSVNTIAVEKKILEEKWIELRKNPQKIHYSSRILLVDQQSRAISSSCTAANKKVTNRGRRRMRG